MEWLAFERFAATWKDYEAAYGYQEMFYWKMGRAGLCFVVTGMCQCRTSVVLQFELDGREWRRSYSLYGRLSGGGSCPSLGRQAAVPRSRDAYNLTHTQACTASFCPRFVHHPELDGLGQWRRGRGGPRRGGGGAARERRRGRRTRGSARTGCMDCGVRRGAFASSSYSHTMPWVVSFRI